MKKLTKSVMGLSAVALAFGAAYAAESLSSMRSTEAEDGNVATATWALGEKQFSGVAADVSDASVISSSNLSYEGLSTNRVRTAKPSTGEIKLTTWNTSVSATPVETDYVQFSITTQMPFTPTQLSLNSGAIKTGNARMDIVAEIGGTAYTISEGVIPSRVEENEEKDADQNFYLSYELTDMPAVVGDMAIKFYLYGDAGKAREIGFSDVTITGTYDATADDCYFHIPGTFVVPESNTDEHYAWGGNMGVEGDAGDKNFCNCYEGATITFLNVHVHETGAYKAVVPLDWSTGNGAMLRIEVTDVESGQVEASCYLEAPKNNYKWEPADFPLDGTINEGVKDIKFSFTPGEGRNWAFNFKAPEFVRTGEGGGETPEPGDVPEGWMTFPGLIDIDHPCWVYDGLRIEGGGANVGYAKNGCSATGEVYVMEEGVYSMNVNFNWFSNPGEFQIEITDQATKIKEVDTYYHIPGVHVADILLEGLLTPGKKTIKYTFHSESSGFIANYVDHMVTKVGDKFAALKNLTVEGVEPIEFEGYDFTFNIPMAYDAETVKLNADFAGCTLKATMGETELPVSADGVIEVPTPAPGEACEVMITLVAEEGVASAKTEFKVRIYHIGGIVISSVDIDGLQVSDEMIAALNENKEGVNLTDYVFTTMPEVNVTFLDGSSVKAEGEMVADHTAEFKFQGVAGDETQNFSFTLESFYFYQPGENDKTATLVYDSGYKGEDLWSNGLYSITCNDGWDGKQFKMKSGNPVTLTTPSDMKIKQIVMARLRDNYTPGRVVSVTSEGATTYLPTASYFTTGVDDAHSLNLVINVENHVAGTPFVITFEGGSQPVAWFEFIYETVAPTTAPEVVKTSATTVEDRNHAVVTFQFNRAMNDATINVNGQDVKAEGGSSILNFSLWDLPYNTDVEVTIPAGAVSDTYGNATETAYTHTLHVGAPKAAEAIAAERFIVISDTEELFAAVAQLASTNSKNTDSQTVIFLKNGDYDLGSTALGINKVYNVSLIGESQEGVLIHGVQTGISYPVVSTRYSTNVYMENLTIRNDLDFGKAERAGVGVAHYGGELDIFKNVTLQSIQDTEVTGNRGYWYNVTIHGSVDYICGGGDHFFDHCNIVHEIAGGYIVAPATSTANKFGYVFQGCTIDGVGPYDLGRPWQNEPRAFFLNTTMKQLANPGGWGRMSDLITHFYEYNSMDADGNAIDLSTRVNSPSSLNTYSPILPEEYAPYFTVRNVLGGLDSWDAAAMVAECEAPAAIQNENGAFSWEAVEGAAGYLVYYDGQFVAYTSVPEFAPEAGADVELYTVAAINANGCRGQIASFIVTGVDEVLAGENDAVFYNLQGVRVSDDAKGVVIRVSRAADGSIKSEKIVRK